MTHDFLDEFTIACGNENVPYVVIIGARNGQSAFITSDLKHWKPQPGRTPQEEIMQLLKVVELE